MNGERDDRVPGWLAERQRRRRIHRQVEHLPAVLDAVARHLRAGVALPGALRRVSADTAIAGPELRDAVRRMDDGVPVVAALDNWAAGLDHPDSDLVRAVLNTGTATGGALAAALDRAAARLRERGELHREIRALATQARVSAVVLTVAPVAFLAVMLLADPDLGSTVLTDPRAAVGVVVGVVLDLLGWLWMRRLVGGVNR